MLLRNIVIIVLLYCQGSNCSHLLLPTTSDLGLPLITITIIFIYRRSQETLYMIVWVLSSSHIMDAIKDVICQKSSFWESLLRAIRKIIFRLKYSLKRSWNVWLIKNIEAFLSKKFNVRGHLKGHRYYIKC